MTNKPLASGNGIWFEQQIADLLRAVSSATNDVLQSVPTPEAKIYQAGFDAAIAAMARGFGVESTVSLSRTRTHSDEWQS